jgi:tRNA nucleotidyltransferase (CCA-adding enzyme)
VLEVLPAIPGGSAVLAVADRFAGLWVVGGAVRDVLLGAEVRDLDLATEGDPAELAAALGTVLEEHGRFGTAEVEVADGAIVNVAATRTEVYPRPGALPVVRWAPIDADLERRDFGVNAIAVGLSALERGEVRAPAYALEDVEARRLRVLHDRSFSDDPTRLLRLARYESRLGLAVEAHTAALAHDASLATVSGDRVGNEVRLLLDEDDPVAALAAGARWGGVRVPDPDADRARPALALLPADGRQDLLVLASAGLDRPPARFEERLRDLGFTAAEVRRAGQAAEAGRLAAELSRAERPSEIADAARGWPVEAVALAGACGAEEPARRWLEELRHVRLSIGGDDLLAAGVPEGPEVGRRLRAALARRLDGELAPGRGAEMTAALEA